MHRLKQSRTSPHSPGPQPETLTTASGPDDAVDVSHGRELWTSSSYTAVAVSLTEFDPAKLESRHDALDSPSTLCIRVPSPLAWGRNNVGELRAEAARGGRWWPCLDSHGVTFFFVQHNRGTCCRLPVLLYIYLVPVHVVRVVSVSYEKIVCLFST